MELGHKHVGALEALEQGVQGLLNTLLQGEGQEVEDLGDLSWLLRVWPLVGIVVGVTVTVGGWGGCRTVKRMWVHTCLADICSHDEWKRSRVVGDVREMFSVRGNINMQDRGTVVVTVVSGKREVNKNTVKRG